MDTKGRVCFPTKLRDILGPEFYLCIGHDDHYISVYSPEEFELYRDKLFQIAGKQGSEVRRVLLANCDRQIADKQGRIFISQSLRKHAGISEDDGEVFIVGSGNHAEIWNKAAWDAKYADISIEDISDILSGLVL